MWASAFSLWLGVSQWASGQQDVLSTPSSVAKPSRPMTSFSASSHFELKGGPDRFSPKDLISLPNPGLGVANPDKEDLVLISVSQYSFEDKKWVQVERREHVCTELLPFCRLLKRLIYFTCFRKNVTTYIQPLDSADKATAFPILSGGDVFWLDSRTLAHVVGERIWAVSLEYKTKPKHKTSSLDSSSPYLIGTFPTGSSPYGFKFNGEVLVFVARVYSDYNLTTVKEQDEAWDNRGTSALVYDSLFVRHWDTYRGPKSQKLFSVELSKGADGKWALGTEYYTPLKGTNHVSTVNSLQLISPRVYPLFSSLHQ
jgi:hypothetical protein